MTRWHPDNLVKQTVIQFGMAVRGKTAEQLWDMSKFYNGKKNFGMSGITYSRKKIVFSSNLIRSTDHNAQSSIIYHELVHVAQQADWGWFRFMMSYLGEWIASGFTYRRMKDKSIEKEAYDKQYEFNDYIGHWMPPVRTKLWGAPEPRKIGD